MPSPPAHEGFWDQAYRHGDHLEHWEAPEPSPDLLPTVRRALRRADSTVLDIGCGAGIEAIHLARSGIAVLAVDSSAVALELARGRAVAAGVTVDWRLGDATRLPLRDREVDLAIDRGCFHVISRRRRRLYAREVARVLRPGGTLWLRGARHDDDELGVVGFDRLEIDRRFGAVGFDRGEFEPIALRARSGDLPAWSVTLELRS